MTLNTRVPRVRRIVALVVSPVQELDLVGPVEVFAQVNRILQALGPAYRIEVVAAGPRRAIAGECGLSLRAHALYPEIRGKVDTLLVMAGVSSRNVSDDRLFEWLRRMAHRVRRLASICVGTFVLAEAGLLHRRRATTHWALVDELAARYPTIEVQTNPIWVEDGNIYTSAGVTAGMDLALALVEQDHGSAIALQVARGLVLFLRRPGGQSQFSVSLTAQASERRVLRDLQAWMADNLHRRMTVDMLAARAAMSPRNFARVFARETGATPGKYVEKLRLEAARRQLEDSDKNLKEIASSCGFASPEVMRRLFLRSLNLPPSAYRSHFYTNPAPMRARGMPDHTN